MFMTLVSLFLVAQRVEGAEKGITLRLLACEASKEPAEVWLETGTTKSDVFELPSSGLSEPMSVSGRSVELKSPDQDAPLCTITLPDQGKSFAVLLATEDPAEFVPALVRLDDEAFKPGDFYFVNHTPKTVVVEMGETELVLEAGKTQKSRPTEAEGKPFYNVTMSERAEANDKVFASTRWPVANENRSLVIFLTKANGRTIYRTVEE
ncbi:MAG: hypothetical protein WBG04_10075 [Haloferula sp.]